MPGSQEAVIQDSEISRQPRRNRATIVLPAWHAQMSPHAQPKTSAKAGGWSARLPALPNDPHSAAAASKEMSPPLQAAPSPSQLPVRRASGDFPRGSGPHGFVPQASHYFQQLARSTQPNQGPQRPITKLCNCLQPRFDFQQTSGQLKVLHTHIHTCHC